MTIAVIGAHGHQGHKQASLLKGMGFPVTEVEIDDPLPCEVDVAVIASPTPNHFDHAKFYCGRGIPCLVEKPLCQTVEQVEELLTLPHRLCAVNFNLRFGRSSRFIGRPQALHAVRQYARDGNGTPLERMGIHDIDLVHYLFPDKPLGGWLTLDNTRQESPKRFWLVDGVETVWYESFTLQQCVMAFLLQVSSPYFRHPALATFEQSIPVMKYIESLQEVNYGV